MNKYQIVKRIGDGAYSTVYQAINKITGEKVALKALNKRTNSIEECMSIVEVKSLKNLSHKNVIKLLEILRENTGQTSLIFELCDCNLLEFMEMHINNHCQIPEIIICEIIYQILLGLVYLHSNNYIHRDIKPENILLILNGYQFNSNTNSNRNKLQIKISDFGTTRYFQRNDPNPLTDYISTRWYRSPECLLQSVNYNEKVDIWSLGCMIPELYNLKPIFPGDNEIDQINKIFSILGTPSIYDWPKGYKLNLKLGINFPYFPKINLKNLIPRANDDAIYLLNEMLQYDDEKRPSSSQLLNFRYFDILKNNENMINNYGKTANNFMKFKGNLLNNIGSVNSDNRYNYYNIVPLNNVTNANLNKSNVHKSAIFNGNIVNKTANNIAVDNNLIYLKKKNQPINTNNNYLGNPKLFNNLYRSNNFNNINNSFRYNLSPPKKIKIDNLNNNELSKSLNNYSNNYLNLSTDLSNKKTIYSRINNNNIGNKLGFNFYPNNSINTLQNIYNINSVNNFYNYNFQNTGNLFNYGGIVTEPNGMKKIYENNNYNNNYTYY